MSSSESKDAEAEKKRRKEEKKGASVKDREITESERRRGAVLELMNKV